MGHLSWYIDQANNGHIVFFEMTTAHPDSLTLAKGPLTATSFAPVIPTDPKGPAQAASVGFISQEVDWFFFPTSPSSWATRSPIALVFDHQERLVLTLVESVIPGEVFGDLKNPNWADKIPIRSLTAYDHPSKGLVLYGIDGNGAAISVVVHSF